MSYPINLDVEKMKVGDVFSTFDGKYHDDLVFLSADDEFVYASDKDISVKFDKISVQINGHLTPREIIDTFAIGSPTLENRRPIELKLVKRMYKDIPKETYYLYGRQDKTTGLKVLEPFSKYVLDGSDREIVKNGGELLFELYVVEDLEFCKKETERVRLLEVEQRKEYLKQAIREKEIELVNLKDELDNL